MMMTLTRDRTPFSTLLYKHTTAARLYHVWACKREIFSELSCEKFIKTCDRIKDCMETMKNRENSGKMMDLPLDNRCYSPLPISTLNPLPQNDKKGTGYFPGMIGRSINYVLPLESSYPRVFKRLVYTGFETTSRSDMKKERKKLFFNLFLEDCRHKHKFEGFLIEPFFVDKVDYLICSIPVGLDSKYFDREL